MTLLAVSPILTLVFVLLISIVKIDSAALAVDLSNPKILAGVSFLLAATSWKLWEKPQGVAGKLVGEGNEDPATS